MELSQMCRWREGNRTGQTCQTSLTSLTGPKASDRMAKTLGIPLPLERGWG